MITIAEIRDIISTYEKHGWTLRRILLSEDMQTDLAVLSADDVPVFESDIDAAWFSRKSINDRTAWELRYLGQSQFALLIGMEPGKQDEAALRETEKKLRAAITRLPAGH